MTYTLHRIYILYDKSYTDSKRRRYLMSMKNLNIRIDEDLKAKAETIQAIEDVNNNRGMSKPFNDIKDLMVDLNAED